MNLYGNLSSKHSSWSILLAFTTYLLGCAWKENVLCCLWWFLD